MAQEGGLFSAIDCELTIEVVTNEDDMQKKVLMFDTTPSFEKFPIPSKGLFKYYFHFKFKLNDAYTVFDTFSNVKELKTKYKKERNVSSLYYQSTATVTHLAGFIIYLIWEFLKKLINARIAHIGLLNIYYDMKDASYNPSWLAYEFQKNHNLVTAEINKSNPDRLDIFSTPVSDYPNNREVVEKHVANRTFKDHHIGIIDALLDLKGLTYSQAQQENEYIKQEMNAVYDGFFKANPKSCPAAKPYVDGFFGLRTPASGIEIAKNAKTINDCIGNCQQHPKSELCNLVKSNFGDPSKFTELATSKMRREHREMVVAKIEAEKLKKQYEEQAREQTKLLQEREKLMQPACKKNAEGFTICKAANPLDENNKPINLTYTNTQQKLVSTVIDHLKSQPLCKNFKDFLDFMTFATKTKKDALPPIDIKKRSDFIKLKACLHPDNCIGHDKVCHPLSVKVQLDEDTNTVTVDRRGFLEEIKKIAKDELKANNQ